MKWPKVKEAVDFHQSNCKKSRVRPLDASHQGQSPKAVAIQNDSFLKKVTGSCMKLFKLDGNGNPNHTREAVIFFLIEKSIIDKILAVRSYALLSARNQVGGCSFGSGLWACPLEASHYGRPSRSRGCVGSSWPKVWTFSSASGGFTHTTPSRRLHFTYLVDYLFSAHFFGLSTKFGHSTPRPLNLDRPSCRKKRPFSNHRDLDRLSYRCPKTSRAPRCGREREHDKQTE
jgi:hypothetical protein